MRNEKDLAELKNNKDLAAKEYAKCIESEEYFYNMWCKRKGDPEYSPKVFNDYKESTEERISLQHTKFRRFEPKPNFEDMSKFYHEYPVSAEKAFKLKPKP